MFKYENDWNKMFLLHYNFVELMKKEKDQIFFQVILLHAI